MNLCCIGPAESTVPSTAATVRSKFIRCYATCLSYGYANLSWNYDARSTTARNRSIRYAIDTLSKVCYSCWLTFSKLEATLAAECGSDDNWSRRATGGTYNCYVGRQPVTSQADRRMYQISLTQTTTAASHQTTTALPSLQIHPTASSQSPSKESSIQPAHPQMTVAEPSTTTSSPSVRPSTVSTPAVRLPSHINATSEVTTMTSLPSSARPSHQITVIEATPFP